MSWKDILKEDNAGTRNLYDHRYKLLIPKLNEKRWKDMDDWDWAWVKEQVEAGNFKQNHPDVKEMLRELELYEAAKR